MLRNTLTVMVKGEFMFLCMRQKAVQVSGRIWCPSVQENGAQRGRVPWSGCCCLHTKSCVVTTVNVESQAHILSSDTQHFSWASCSSVPVCFRLWWRGCCSQIFCVQLKQFEHGCSLPWYDEGLSILCCVGSSVSVWLIVSVLLVLEFFS